MEKDVCYLAFLPLGCVYSRGKLRFLSGRPRDLWHCIFRHSFCSLGANYCNLFYDCSSFASLGEVFAHGGEFLYPFQKSLVKVMELRLLLTRHCIHYCLVKNQGGCSFGLFNYDRYVSFRAIGVLSVI